MKGFVKAIGWLALAALGIAAFVFISPENQRVMVLLAAGYLVAWTIGEWLKDHANRVYASLDRIEQRLKAIEDHPLNTKYIADGLEGIVDEYTTRRRAAADLDRELAIARGATSVER